MAKILKSFILIILVLGVTIAFTYSKTIGIGASKSEVQRTMGTPNETIKYINSETWFYNKSSITFSNNKVSEWSNLGNLKVSMGNKNLSAGPIQVTSSKKQVVDAMGTPSSIIKYPGKDIWFYKMSFVIFENNKVLSWRNNGNLYISETEQEYTRDGAITKEEITIANNNALHSAVKATTLFKGREFKGSNSMAHLAVTNSFYNKYGSSKRY